MSCPRQLTLHLHMACSSSLFVCSGSKQKKKKIPFHLFMKEKLFVSMLYGEEIPTRVFPGYLCKAEKKPESNFNIQPWQKKK